MTGEFQLHQKLEADTISLGRSALCDILLMNDQSWPWVLLVPRRSDIREIYQLSVADQQLLLAESSLLGEGMMKALSGDKLNVAALGNRVPQLHLHHIVRRQGDAGWPGPVWGIQPPEPYTDDKLARCRALLGPVLGHLTAP